MDENVIFTKNEQPSSTVGQQPQPVTSTQGSVPPPTPPPAQNAGIPASPPPLPKRSVGWKKVLLFAGIAVVVLLIMFVLFRVGSSFFGNAKAENVTLTYWGLWEDDAVMKSVLTDFHREHPEITVNYVRKDIKQYRQSLVTQINNGTGPDVYRYHNSWTPVMQSILQPLSSEVVTPDQFKELYYPVIQRDLIRNGAIYGLPLGMDTIALFVNTELFQAAGVAVPQTWNDFITVSKELTVKDSEGKIQTAGAALGTYDNIAHAPDIISVLMAQNGTNFSQFSSTLDNTTQALEFYTQFAKGQGSVWNETLDPSLIAFAKGNLAMYFGYSWDIFAIKELSPDLAFTTHAVPALPGRQYTVASYWVEGVSSKSKHQKEAMLLMQYLAKKETAQKFYQESAKTRLFGEPYARRDLAETLKSNTLIYPFVSQAETAVSTYFVSDTYDDGLNGPLNAYLGNAVRSMQGNSSGDSAVETLSQGVGQVLGRYGL